MDVSPTITTSATFGVQYEEYQPSCREGSTMSFCASNALPTRGGVVRMTIHGRHMGTDADKIEVLLLDDNPANIHTDGTPVVSMLPCQHRPPPSEDFRVISQQFSSPDCPGPYSDLQEDSQLATNGPCMTISCDLPDAQGANVSVILRKGGKEGQVSQCVAASLAMTNVVQISAHRRFFFHGKVLEVSLLSRQHRVWRYRCRVQPILHYFSIAPRRPF